MGGAGGGGGGGGVVAWGGDEGVLPVVGLGVADEQDGEHVDLFGVEVGEGGKGCFLFGSSGLAHVADGGLG